MAGSLEFSLDRFDGNSRVEGKNSSLVGKERIDVELANLRPVGGKLGKLDQNQGNVRLAGRRNVAVGLENARYPRACNRGRLKRTVISGLAALPCKHYSNGEATTLRIRHIINAS